MYSLCDTALLKNGKLHLWLFEFVSDLPVLIVSFFDLSNEGSIDLPGVVPRYIGFGTKIEALAKAD